MKSMKTKLIIYFSILILSISVVLGYISLRTVRQAVTSEVEEALVLLAEEGSRLTATRMEVHYTYLEGLASRERISNPESDLETKIAILLEEVEKTENFLRIGISDLKGNLYLSDSYGIRGSIVDVSEREYYHDSLSGKRGLLPPAISVNVDDHGALIVVYSVPVTYENSIVGVLVAVADANFLNILSDDMGFGDQGYAYIIDGNGIVIAHPNRDRVVNQFNPILEVESNRELTSLAHQFQQMLEEKRGVNSYSFEGNDIYAGYAGVQGTDWIMVITANEEEVMDALPRLQRNIALMVFIILIISIIVCYLIGSSITKPVIATVKHGEKIAALDITEDVPEVFLRRRDEIGTLAAGFQNITDNLREFVRQLADTSQLVAASSQQLTATSQQSATAAEEVARTIEEIARGATDQAKDTEIGVLHINELGGLIEKDQQYIQQLNLSTEEVDNLKNQGFEILKDLVAKTKVNNESTKEIYAIIVNTNDSAEKIEIASQMIRSIAEQTNLLALNAAIEAARAGEAGRGFAVVAEEIRKLAEQSNQFTTEIASIIEELTSKTTHAVTTMQEVEKIVASQGESVEMTNRKFEGIATAIEKIKKAIDIINQSSKTMAGKKNEIVGIIENLSAISEENAAGTEEASAAVEEQTASMEEIANASEGLAKIAEEMQRNINQFKI
ncbi:methyl-accepting chemotaxis protein TlpB [Clostridium aceticum]|uniref:Methyl-accepting chemotaxis protein TlpB n=1 Tax=Clostridium aceticum TaxID=84022 RepID=A0A0D8IA12_9CLOT|nr:methyl-accepting chemotaxis protein [Clostridium aceticum]AKL95935.1 methyl-accepting chemotaxis protein TlpB [Clostridium aceticum]KJF27113.1 chemotaxis protein [Clostridium aceticum]